MIFLDPHSLNEQIRLVNAAIAKQVVDPATDEEYLSILMDARVVMQRYVTFKQQNKKPFVDLSQYKTTESMYVNIDTFEYVTTVGDMVYGVSDGERVVVDTKNQVFCHIFECKSVMGTSDNGWFGAGHLNEWRRLNKGQRLDIEMPEGHLDGIISLVPSAVVKVITQPDSCVVMCQLQGKGNSDYYGTKVDAPLLEVVAIPSVAA